MNPLKGDLSPVEVKSGYPVMEAFHTLQGEGCHQGKSAYFIRLGGCDVGCHWCDVKDSWPIEAHPFQTVETLVGEAKSSGAEIVVITGGEPLMHDLSELVSALQLAGLRVHYETAGVHEFSGTPDWVTFSPKKFKDPRPEYFAKASELKIVVFHSSDIKWAIELSEKVNSDCLLYLQPEWDKQSKVLPELIAFVKSNPRWRISLQTHKYLDIP